MIVAATLLCDLKQSSTNVALPRMLEMDGDVTFYVNIQTEDSSKWTEVVDMLETSKRPYAIDYWNSKSSWNKRSEKDQDSSRLEPICVARNMARNFALVSNATHLFFVDADVRLHRRDALTLLLQNNYMIVGGLVPGRGAHSHAQYVFHIKGHEYNKPHVILCTHGTLGCCLIQRVAFSVIPFRYGPHPAKRDLFMSEDPCFAADVEMYLKSPYWAIDTRVTCDHVDDPDKPLTMDQADNGYITN